MTKEPNFLSDFASITDAEEAVINNLDPTKADNPLEAMHIKMARDIQLLMLNAVEAGRQRGFPTTVVTTVLGKVLAEAAAASWAPTASGSPIARRLMLQSFENSLTDTIELLERLKKDGSNNSTSERQGSGSQQG